MLTERDVVRCVAEGIDRAKASVRDVMSSSIVAAPMTTTPLETIRIMQEKTGRRVLVVDDLGGVAGILTQTDIGRILDRRGLPHAGRFLAGTDGRLETSHGSL